MKFLVVPVIVALCFIQPTSTRAAVTNRAKAKKLNAEGRKLFAQKKYRGALNKFKEAWRYRQHYYYLYNIASMHARLGEPVAAVTYLRRYMKRARTPEERKVSAILQKTRQQVGILVVQVPNHKASRILNRNAQIWIDSLRKGSGRVELVLMPGSKKVAIKLRGKVVESREVLVIAGRETPCTIPVASKIPTLTPPPPKRRRPAGILPPERKPAKSSRRTVWKALFGTTLGLGVGLLAAAIGTGVKVWRIEDEKNAKLTEIADNDNVYLDAENACKDATARDYPDFLEICDRGERFALATTVLVSAGAGLLIASGILAVIAFRRKTVKKEDRSNWLPVKLSATVGPGGASVTMGLEF